MYPHVYILRHGETEWNLARRFQGALDSPLTVLGREQAARQAAILARVPGIDDRFRFVTSPLGRARATAEIALAPFGLAIAEDARLAEISLGAWDGLTAAEIDARAPGLRDSDDDLYWMEHAEGGEGFGALEARLADFLADLDRPSVIVTHGVASMVLRGLMLDIDRDEIAALPNAQGIVYCVREGAHSILSLPQP